MLWSYLELLWENPCETKQNVGFLQNLPCPQVCRWERKAMLLEQCYRHSSQRRRPGWWRWTCQWYTTLLPLTVSQLVQPTWTLTSHYVPVRRMLHRRRSDFHSWLVLLPVGSRSVCGLALFLGKQWSLQKELVFTGFKKELCIVFTGFKKELCIVFTGF